MSIKSLIIIVCVAGTIIPSVCHSQEPDSLMEYYSQKVNDCFSEKRFIDWTPEQLMELYLSEDKAGKFTELTKNEEGFQSYTDLDKQKYMLCPGYEPGGRIFTIIKNYRVTIVEINSCTAWIGVTYDVVAEYSRDQLIRKGPRTDKILFLLVRTEYGWKIVKPMLNPHIGIEWGLTMESLIPEDRVFLELHLE